MVSWLKDTAKPVAGTSKETPVDGIDLNVKKAAYDLAQKLSSRSPVGREGLDCRARA